VQTRGAGRGRGDHITNDLALGLRVSRADAEEIKAQARPRLHRDDDENATVLFQRGGSPIGGRESTGAPSTPSSSARDENFPKSSGTPRALRESTGGGRRVVTGGTRCSTASISAPRALSGSTPSWTEPDW